jgi:hypothetical protein
MFTRRFTHLENNHISDDGAVAIAKALMQNRHLLKLRLSNVDLVYDVMT